MKVVCVVNYLEAYLENQKCPVSIVCSKSHLILHYNIIQTWCNVLIYEASFNLFSF